MSNIYNRYDSHNWMHNNVGSLKHHLDEFISGTQISSFFYSSRNAEN